MISVTKQMEAAEANVFHGGLQNDNEEESFTGLWRLLSARGAMLELHLSLRTGCCTYSLNDLRISFRETGTAVHMIFEQTEFRGSRPLVLSQVRYCGSER